MAILDEPLERGMHLGVLERIRVALPDLRPSERRVADKILQDPGQAVALSINEFAQMCDVSQPTISRFCRKLGFSGYAALRISITNDLASTSSNAHLFSLTSGSPNFTEMVDGFRAMAAIQLGAQAIRTATHVEIWATSDLAPTGMQIADRLAALAVPAACATLSRFWSERARNLPPKSVVILLIQTLTNAEIEAAFIQAQLAHAQVLCCVTQSAGAFVHGADWLIPLPDISPAGLVELALVEALVTNVENTFQLTIPEGPASPWRPWHHVRKIFLPGHDEPIPALLLTREDPPRPRPVIIFFGSFRMTKEESLPGQGEHFIARSLVAAFLNAGYHVLIVDARAHGERKRAWERTDRLVRMSLKGEGEDVLANAGLDAPYLVDGVLSLGICDDPAQIAVVGTSWGGLQTALTFAGDARICCAVGILPYLYLPYLEDFADLGDEPRVASRKPDSWDGTLFAPRPFRLIVGEQDELADYKYIRQFENALRPAYTAARADEHLQTVLIPGLGHVWHQQEVDATIDWLKRFFGTQTPKNG